MRITGWITQGLNWLRRFLSGLALSKSLERNEKAARELDAAVREVLQK